jgi:hypothetical protein
MIKCVNKIANKIVGLKPHVVILPITPALRLGLKI